MSIKNSKRDWLNPKDSDDTGAVASSYWVEADNNGILDVGCSLDLRDCNRAISLNFSLWSKLGTAKQRKSALRRIAVRKKKVEILREHLDLIEEGLDEAERAVLEYKNK